MVGIDVEEELSQSGQAQLDLKVHYTYLSLPTYYGSLVHARICF